MDNKEIGIFCKAKEVDNGEICAFDNQSSGFPYSVDRPLIIYYDTKKEPVKPKMITEVPSPFPYKENKAVPDNQSSGFPYSVDRPLIIYYDTKKEPVKPKMITEVPSPFPYKENKAVPWKYNVNIIAPEGEKPETTTEDIGEVGHFTRSGRCYSKEVEPVKK
ncbi:hypothetical protein GOBAR_AA36481 [Gossypium barbadense]|uniref:Uncharacterized protein n=1 Tax=Gossypium barbadense TaxID=3634 RepID=A0A2P5VZG2_GOSBA|nr:hypothetical protein GOBAR_AA36481 [Gossypium barbadense]